MDVDIQFMQEALAEARSAAEAGEVPVGALLVPTANGLVPDVLTVGQDRPTSHHYGT